MYRFLSEQGIKTFYSNVSLLDFGEAAYKEVIDNALDKLQEIFGSPSFWYGETMLVSVAKKK